MEFEWEDAKADANQAKHSIIFTEAMTVFADPLALTGFDPDHSLDEDLFITMGESLDGKLLIVSHTDRDDRIRIISAREANRKERKDYEDGNFP